MLLQLSIPRMKELVAEFRIPMLTGDQVDIQLSVTLNHLFSGPVDSTQLEATRADPHTALQVGEA